MAGRIMLAGAALALAGCTQNRSPGVASGDLDPAVDQYDIEASVSRTEPEDSPPEDASDPAVLEAPAGDRAAADPVASAVARTERAEAEQSPGDRPAWWIDEPEMRDGLLWLGVEVTADTLPEARAKALTRARERVASHTHAEDTPYEVVRSATRRLADGRFRWLSLISAETGTRASAEDPG